LERIVAEIPQGDAGGIPPRAEGIEEGERRRRTENCDRGVGQDNKNRRSSLRAQRSNPSHRAKKEWIASSLTLLAMTECFNLSVIPGRVENATPESRKTTAGFRVWSFGPSRNDERNIGIPGLAPSAHPGMTE
jgi:hypothetical protein